jgi:hypothetical protein
VRRRNAERIARHWIARYAQAYAHWHFDLCEEFAGDASDRRKSWSFGLEPDEEDDDYEPDRRFTGYVHRDGAVEGLY